MQLTTDRGIHAEVTGSGPPVLLLNSFWCSGSMWQHQVSALSQNYRVINMNHRGHGASLPVKARFDMHELVLDAFSVLDELELKSAIWAGLSIGGMTAMRAALFDPNRVQALILLDTDAEAFPGWVRLRYRILSALARVIGLRPFIGEVTRKMFGSTTLRERQDLVAEWQPQFAAADRKSILYMLGALIRRGSILDRLSEIYCPTLVISGVEDTSIPTTRTRRVAEGVQQATMLELAEAGHLCCLERPEAVNQAMLEFLDGLAELRGARSLQSG